MDGTATTILLGLGGSGGRFLVAGEAVSGRFVSNSLSLTFSIGSLGGF